MWLPPLTRSTGALAIVALVVSFALGVGACRKRQAHYQSLELSPSPVQQRKAAELARQISTLLPAGPSPQHPLFDLAPQLGDVLAQYCATRSCESFDLLPLFPAGRGLVVRPRVIAGAEERELSPLFLRLRAEEWELLDALPAEIEAGPRQLAVRGAVELDPEDSTIAVDATIEILSADQRFLLFDFFDEHEAGVQGLAIKAQGKPLRFTRQGQLLIVELPEGTRSADLHFRYTATLKQGDSLGHEFVLFENWLPYLGGRASWALQVDVPEAFELGTPSSPLGASRPGRKRYKASADSLDRYPLVGSSLSYATTSFEHQGTLFEVWLRPEHASHLSRVASALRSSMDAYEFLGAFPSARYRVLEAPYAGGHGAIGLRDLMVLGEELLDEDHLLPAIAHELAHAWFAGLLRDPQGRWSEGLASYLSQWPLSKERARKMRWGWMVGYEQVPDHRDTPLKGDTPAPQEDEELSGAIFYGKAALVLQELEGRVGTQKMRQILSLFVYQYRGRSVRWRELQQSLADVMGNEEARRFGLWLEEKTAPDWEVRALAIDKAKLRGELWQSSDFPFQGSVVVATMSEQSEVLSEQVVETGGERVEFSLDLSPQARWVVVDPNYTMPRRGSQDGKPRWMVRIRD